MVFPKQSIRQGQQGGKVLRTEFQGLRPVRLGLLRVPHLLCVNTIKVLHLGLIGRGPVGGIEMAPRIIQFLRAQPLQGFSNFLLRLGSQRPVRRVFGDIFDR